jgi:hypothetical protein
MLNLMLDDRYRRVAWALALLALALLSGCQNDGGGGGGGGY